MTTKCIDQDFLCQAPEYEEFDRVARAELHAPMSAAEIINESLFCTELPIDPELIMGDVDYKMYLKGIKGESGLYHLWIDHDECDDHRTNTMLCVYVGKGLADKRIPIHIKEKWPDGIRMYATFTKIENRLSKYYEQLFLDTYDFHLNSYENEGDKQLFAVWDEEVHAIGTHLNEVSALSKIQSLEDL